MNTPSQALPLGRLRTLLVVIVLLPAAGCSMFFKRFEARGFEVRPSAATDGGAVSAASRDAALLVQLILTATPGMETRYVVSGKDDPDLFDLSPAGGQAAGSGRIAAAVASARSTLETIPKKRWRKRALKRVGPLGLDALDETNGATLLDALGARALGDPVAAINAIESAMPASPAPILLYELGAARLEAGRLEAAAEAFGRLAESGSSLPPAFLALAGAAVSAARGDARRAVAGAGAAMRHAPSMPEAPWLRAWLSREACDLYNRERIMEDLAAASRPVPCCAGCPILLSEMESFTGQPLEAVRALSAPTPCAAGVLQSARDRALALAYASAGEMPRALSVAADAEAHDASPLLPGLAPVFLLGGDNAHLVEAYDSEGDLTLGRSDSVQQQLYSGLNALWTGRPSEAALHFERAEEEARAASPDGWTPRSMIQLLGSLRMRSYLLAGRLDEAELAAGEVRAKSAKEVNGILAYSASQVALATGRLDEALTDSRRLTNVEEKFWIFLTEAHVFIERKALRRAGTAFSNALRGVNTQINFCPGLPVEPFVMDAQARLLIARGQPEEAARAARALLAMGPRGLFAPDLVLPAWELLGRALEAAGDRSGALEAYRKLQELWSGAEPIPLMERVAERVKALS